MNTLWKYSYFVYLIIAVILVYEGTIQLGKDTNLALIIFAIAIMMVVKFFITKRLRKRIDKRNRK